MRLYRSTLTLRSASASAWQADMLFGHLCWSLVRREGEQYLSDSFLSQYRQGNPPVLMSDGFPTGFLPRPRAAARDGSHERLAKSERVRRYRESKDGANARWLSLDEFNRACRGQFVLAAQQPQTAVRIVSKNQIDRITNTAGGASGELYDFEEFCLDAVDVYWRIADGCEPLVRDFLSDLQSTGYGKRKSVGYGDVASFTLEPFNGFGELPAANGFVTLSNFVPAQSDPINGAWTTTVKYGKLSEDLGHSGLPFKRPMVQLAAGSCFYDSPIRDCYGRLVANVADDSRVVQYGFAFAVPMQLPE